jgi:hypothetical protein
VKERFRGPVWDWLLEGQGRIGVVLGNGPSVDQAPAELFELLRHPQFVACGVNRICCSSRLRELNYRPNLHYTWDHPLIDTATGRLHPVHAGIWRGCEEICGRSWRVAEVTSGPPFPCDQRLTWAGGWVGRGPGRDESVMPPFHEYVCDNSAAAAAHGLARLGCRLILLLGVDYTSGGHLATDIPPAYEIHSWAQEERTKVALETWKQFVLLRPWCELRSLNAESRLVTEGICRSISAAEVRETAGAGEAARESDPLVLAPAPACL